ncbi:hypothetical protein [Rasiella sp. SM2506]|uniref:hypothetical protein n=1 Tax=Rasiella sp. SM2506 TaxID=3423914 RepID=UPI003D7B40E3
MKTQDNKIAKRISIAFVIVMVTFISIPFGFGMYSGITLHTGVTGKLEKAIDQHCECEDVKFSLSTYGLQISKEDGFTNQKASYILKNCKYEGTVVEEATRINDYLKSTVAGYNTLDLIELTFKSAEISETVKIKDGNIL